MKSANKVTANDFGDPAIEYGVIAALIAVAAVAALQDLIRQLTAPARPATRKGVR